MRSIARQTPLCKSGKLWYTLGMKRLLLPLILSLLLLAPTQAALGADLIRDDFLVQTGSKGEAVVRVQTRLMDLGYYLYKPTGSFQTVSRKAVTRFQSTVGLLADGAIGQQSAALLFSAACRRPDFSPVLNCVYTSRGSIAYKGVKTPWSSIKKALLVGTEYSFTDCISGESFTLTYSGGSGHAAFGLSANTGISNAAAAKLNAWLGGSNDFYKMAVLVEIEGVKTAASLQWDGAAAQVYFYGSSSVLGLADVEHNAFIDAAGT